MPEARGATPSALAQTDARGATRGVRLRIAGLHLAALWALALVQPLFELLGRNPQFFVVHDDTALDILVFAIGFAIAPPLVLVGLEWLAGRVRAGLQWVVHLVFIGVLVAVLVLPPLGRLLDGSAVAIVPAVLIGAVAASLYARTEVVRLFASVLSPVPLVILFLFLVTSPVSKLVFPTETISAAGLGRSSTPVVMIVLDELPVTSLMGPGNRIDARHYPKLAGLARDATWYRNAMTVADGTTEAVPALLTGMRSRPGELPTAADHPRSIFTLLGRSHRLYVEEPITDVCPDALCGGHRPGRLDRLRLLQHDLRIVEAHLLLPEGLRGGLPAIDRGWEGFGLEDTTKPSSGVTVTEQREQLQRQTLERLGQTDTPAEFARIGDSMQPGGGKPGFYFIHAELPHAPWRFLPDGHAYTIHRNSIPGLVNEVWTGPRAVVDQAFQRHLLQTQYADRVVGELLDRLRSARLYDRALVVVTADHGVSFRTGQGRRGPSNENMADIANVPLIIKAPGQHAGRVDDGAVRTIDILPTMSKLLGEPLKWDVDGIPADRRGENPDTPIDVSREFDGGVTTVPFGRVVAMRDARERREERMLGRSPESVYRIGSDTRLLGTRLSTLDVLPAGDARVSLDGAADYARVAPDTGVVPAYVSGAVSGLSQGDEVAIAVDGRVRATTQIRREGSENVFAALVPPASLTAGSHAVVVLQVLGAARLRGLRQGGA